MSLTKWQTTHGPISFLYGTELHPGELPRSKPVVIEPRDPLRGTGRTSRMLLKAMQSFMHPDVRRVVVVVKEQGQAVNALQRLKAIGAAIGVTQPKPGRFLIVYSWQEWMKEGRRFIHGRDGTRVYVDHAAMR
jgi:hypothetical protein